MKTKTAVIFDMDGTLLDNGKYHDKAWDIFCEKYNLEKIDLKAHFGKVNKHFMQDLFGKEISEQEILERAREKELIYREIIEPHLKPINGAQEFIKDLKKSGFLIAMGTAGPKVNVDFILNNFGIAQYFDAIVDDSHITEGKPDPEVFLLAAKKLGVSPHECVVIEDSSFGFEAARRAEMAIVALTTTLNRNEITDVDKIIDDFTEINAQEILNIVREKIRI